MMADSRIFLKNEEKKEILHCLKDFFEKKPEVLFGYVFGSFIRDQSFGDLDLALYLENSGGKKILGLEREIEEFLHLPVEISSLNKAPLSFAFRVIKEGMLIFERDSKVRCDFESKTRVFYFDFSPFYQRYYREVVLGEN